jgi:hypothetical protein
MEHDPQPEAYLVHAWIRDIHPMLWRRFLLRSDCTLADLHFRLNERFLYEYDFGVVSRNRRKFRHPARLSTSELVDALGKESERFVHILQCLGFCALRA